MKRKQNEKFSEQFQNIAFRSYKNSEYIDKIEIDSLETIMNIMSSNEIGAITMLSYNMNKIVQKSGFKLRNIENNGLDWKAIGKKRDLGYVKGYE